MENGISWDRTAPPADRAACRTRAYIQPRAFPTPAHLLTLRPPSAASRPSPLRSPPGFNSRAFLLKRGYPRFPRISTSSNAHMHDAIATTPKKGNAEFSAFGSIRLSRNPLEHTRVAHVTHAPRHAASLFHATWMCNAPHDAHHTPHARFWNLRG